VFVPARAEPSFPAFCTSPVSILIKAPDHLVKVAVSANPGVSIGSSLLLAVKISLDDGLICTPLLIWCREDFVVTDYDSVFVDVLLETVLDEILEIVHFLGTHVFAPQRHERIRVDPVISLLITNESNAHHHILLLTTRA
jgi:hypothetical protein